MVRVVLFAHGSRDPAWRAPFERLERDLRGSVGEQRVRLAYMESCPPTLADIADEAVRDGASRLRILPLFLSGGGHVTKDIPVLVEAVRARHTALTIDVLPAIGEEPRFGALLRELTEEACR